MNTVFKSAKGREKVRTYYNRILSFFPFAQRHMDTSFGKTFVLEAGSSANPAVILLHGSCGNSAVWLGDIPILAEKFHVFAVDIIGEAGNSEENRPGLNKYSLWINELMDALHVTQAVFMGNSLGGWMALHFAAAYPERTASLVLIAASGIAPIKASFIKNTEDFISTGGQNAVPLLDDVLGDAMPKEVREFMALIMENYNPITGELPVLTDEQMRALKMPVLLIAGTNDFTMDAAKAAERLSSLVPHAKVKLIENGSHVIFGVMDSVMPFLSEGR